RKALSNRMKNSRSVEMRMSTDETARLLTEAGKAYNTEINDLLLTALGMAVHAWSGLNRVRLTLEGHGREAIVPGLDVSRTVGWFTSAYPVVLEAGEPEDLAYRIKRTKESLRRVPNKGIGYGILRYLGDSAHQEALFVRPEISFNYLGQFDRNDGS